MSEYPTVIFTSLDHLCEMIYEKTRGWSSIWYRGVPSPNFVLLPAILRGEEIQKTESYISVEFRRRARPLNIDISNPFGCLCSMQHYSLPTRLLDWTESLSIALYFAVRATENSVSAPTVWVLDPFTLYNLTSLEDIIPIASHENVMANADIAFGDDPDTNACRQTKFPLPVLPDLNSPRLAAQNGVFTIHGTDLSPIESIFPAAKRSQLIKFVAHSGRTQTIYESINLIKPSHHNVFPDIEGIRSYLA